MFTVELMFIKCSYATSLNLYIADLNVFSATLKILSFAFISTVSIKIFFKSHWKIPTPSKNKNNTKHYNYFQNTNHIYYSGLILQKCAMHPVNRFSPVTSFC